MTDNIKLPKHSKHDFGYEFDPGIAPNVEAYAEAYAREAVRMNAAQPVDERKEFEDWGRSIGWDTRDLERSSAYRGKYGWKTQQTAWEAWQARAALSAPAVNAEVPEIDYEALIHAAYKRDRKWAQGTNGCIAFVKGAEWFREIALAAAPEPQGVQACGHPESMLLKSAETGEPLYCEACDDKSGRSDAELRETELLAANKELREQLAKLKAEPQGVPEPTVWVAAGHLREVCNGNAMNVYMSAEQDRFAEMPLYAHPQSPAEPAQPEQERTPLSEREIELIDGMIEVQLHHAEACDRIANRVMAEKQKGWDMERVELLRKLKAAHGIKE